MIISVINNKGGVGKTTTVMNVAAALAKLEYKVLAIDIDGQCSLSLALGIERTKLEPSIWDVIFNKVSVKKATRSLKTFGFDIINANESLSNADLILSSITGREKLLYKELEQISDMYDFVLLDCPPSMSLITVNALVASDSYIIPVTPQYLSLEGLISMIALVDHMRSNIEGVANLLGILLTIVDHRNKVTPEIIGLIRKHFDEDVFKSEIKINIRLAEAPSFAKDIFQYDSSSSGAKNYMKLTKEIIEKINI